MFESWAFALNSKKIRWTLITLGVFTTIPFASLSITAAMYFTYLSKFSMETIGLGIFGFGSLLAIAAAWTRLILAPQKFQQSAWLRRITALGLALGIILDLAMLSGMITKETTNPKFGVIGWLLLLTLPIGIFLLGATIGEKRAL